MKRTILTRWEAVLMSAGYLCLGIGFGVEVFVNMFAGFGIYCLGLFLVGVHSTRSFRRGMRVGGEIEREILGSFSLGDIPDDVKDAVAQDMARRVELAVAQRAAAKEGRN